MFRKTQVSWSTRDRDRPGTRVWMQTPPACGALLGKKVSTESLACLFFFRKRNCRWRSMFGCTWDAPPSHPPCLCHCPAPSSALAGTLLKEFQLPALGYQDRPRLWASWPLPRPMTGVSSGSGRFGGTAFKSSAKSLDLSDPLFPCLQNDWVRLKEPPFHILPHSVFLKHLGFGTAHELTQKLS